MSMGIYLPNMAMPKSKPICIAIDVAGQARQYDLNNEKFIDDKLYEAVSVPPHGRCIDADALINDHPRTWTTYDLKRIANAPTIIPASGEGK